MFNERTSNINLNSTFINLQEIFNRTKSSTKQNIQTASKLVTTETKKTTTFSKTKFGTTWLLVERQPITTKQIFFLYIQQLPHHTKNNTPFSTKNITTINQTISCSNIFTYGLSNKKTNY